MQKKMSIMLPVYNMESYVDECLKSLAKQDWDDDVEVIIIDDGSTDASYEICKRYVHKYPYMELYHKENGGVASARNVALKHARGEYFYWVDPDDYITDDFWEKIKPVLHQDYDFIFFDLIYFSGDRSHPKCFGNKSSIIEKEELMSLFCDGVKMASHLPTKIIKKSLWEEIVFPTKISLCEDYAVLTYIVPKSQKTFYLHESLYKYRQHAGSICHNISVQDLRNVHKLVNERYLYFTEQGFCVSVAGILFVEYNYLRDIVLCKNISESVEKYQEIYADMLQHLQKNWLVLLQSGFLGKKEKIILCLLIWNMKGILCALFSGWNLLKNVCE